MPNQRSFVKRLTALLVVIAVALAAEFAIVAAGRVQDTDAYERAVLTVDAFDAWEFQKTGADEYEALANNSYFSCSGIGGMAAHTIEVFFSRDPGDITETVLYYTGVSNGVRGEFVAPLMRTGEGVYTASIDASRLEGVRIYPTERVHTTVRFSGAVVNPTVTAGERFSPGRALTLAMGAGALLCAGLMIAGKIRKRSWVSAWFGVYVISCAAVLVLAFQATRMFSAVGGRQDVLVPLAFGAYSGFYLLLWLLFRRIVKLETKLAVIVFVAGSLFALTSAPLQAPDEHIHFLRAWSVSEGRLGFDYTETFPEDVELLCEMFPGRFNDVMQRTGVANAGSQIEAYLARIEAGDAKGTERFHTPIQLVVPYLPAGAGMAAARLFSANALICLYVGRIMNVAVFAACAFFALKWARRYRGMVVLLALFPLTLFMVASTSYDAMLLSALLLFFGVIFKEEVTGRDLIVLVLAFGLIVSIKPIYLPLALAVFAIPGDAIKGKRPRGGICALVLATGVLLYAASLLYASLFARGIPSSVMPQGVDVQAQILYVLRNPLRYLMVMLVDGYMQGFYLDKFGLFGWLDVMCVLTNLLSPVLVALVAGMYADDSRLQKRSNAWLFAGITLVGYAVVVTGFYTTWSTLGSTSILGVQARYFLPFLPLATAALSRGMAGLMRGTRNEGKRDTTCIYICGLFAVLSAVELGVQYFMT